MFGKNPARARSVGESIQKWVVRFLTVTACMRIVVFVANALGYRVTARGLAPLTSEPTITMWLPAAMMLAIAVMLYRAGWYRPRSGAATGAEREA